MRLIYGTTNIAKFDSMKKVVNGMGISLLSLRDLNITIPDAPEKGNSPMENAEEKAWAYYNIIKGPLFSCDSGLYFENVKPEHQPGVHVRNVNGKYLDDHMMIDYYSKLAKSYGGKLTAYYKNAIYFIFSKEQLFYYDGKDIESEKFFITDKPHQKRRRGFPLDSLSVEIKSGKYYFDEDYYNDNHLEDHIKKGFKAFFTKALKEIL